MDREKSLAKNTAIIAFGTLLPKFSSIITLPIITSGLTKSEYGTYDLITTLVSLFLPIVTFQIQSAAFRFLIDRRGDEEKSNAIITNIFAFIVPVSLVSLLILFFALNSIDMGLRCLINIYFFVDILLLACQQIIRGLSNNKLYSFSSVIQSVTNMLLIVVTVLFFNKGLLGVLTAITGATVIALLFILIKERIIERIHLRLLSKKLLLELLGYSWPMIPNSLSNWVLSVSDRTVVTAFLGIEANAVYAAANIIPSLFSTVQGTFVYAWQENASIVSKDEDVAEYYSKMFDSILRILVGIMAMLIAVAPVLFKFLIRGDYAKAYYQMPILFLGMLFSALASFMGGIYVAHKKTKSVGFTTLCAAVINLSVDLICVNRIGIYAASISTLTSYFVLTIYRMIDVKRFQEIHYNPISIAYMLLSLGLMCVLCWVNTLACSLVNLVIGILIMAVFNRQIIVGLLKNVKKIIF